MPPNNTQNVASNSQQDAVSQIVRSLIANAASLGYSVDSITFSPVLPDSKPAPAPAPWPAVFLNTPEPWIAPVQPYPPMQQYTPYYPHATYFAQPPPNMFWNTVMRPPQQPATKTPAQQPAPDAVLPAKEFVCPRCSATFKTNSNMQKHVRTVHDNCRPFKCDKCDVSYGHKNLLVEHIRTAHDGERPFVCDICGAKFGRSSNLYSHMKSHEGKREHKCKTCNVSFSLHGNMVKHIKTVHLKQRPFVCTLCPSRFGLRSDLMRHRRNVHGVDKEKKKDPPQEQLQDHAQSPPAEQQQ